MRKILLIRARTTWPILLIVFFGAVTYCVDRSIQTALLSATLIALIWYTLETRAQRLHQIERMEVEHHPWLSVETIGSKQQQVTDTLTTSENFELVIQNSGHTPAHDVTVNGYWRVEADHGAEQPNGTFEHNIGVVAPNRKVPFNFTIHWELVKRIAIHVEVSYKSCEGGGGHLKYDYDFLNPGPPLMKNDTLEWRLSDGTRFPKVQRKGAVMEIKSMDNEL